MLSMVEKKSGAQRPVVPVAEPVRFTLTEDQAVSLASMIEYVSEPAQSFEAYLLTGAAGTGKTTVMAEFVRSCKELGLRTVLTAPTNKATRVLRDVAASNGLTVDCSTVYRLLHLTVSSDKAEKYTKKNSRSQAAGMSDFDVVVVDECSMVGDNGSYKEPGLYSQIIAEARRTNTKLVFVGDPNQLPPVKEGESRTFETSRASHLTKVVRQAAGNPIIAMATWLRGMMNGDDVGNCPEPSVVDGVGVEQIKDWDTYKTMVVEAFAESPDHPTKFRALSWRNKLVDSMNAQVRERLFPGASWYQAGERYVATQPVLNVAKDAIVMNTDEDAVVVSVSETHEYRYPQFKFLRLLMETDAGYMFETDVVHPDYRDAWQKACDLLARQCREKKASWRNFWEMSDGFAKLRPHYTTTTHRSQGSTYETVFVNSEDILKNPNKWEAYRCLYVACTRAAKLLVIYDPT